MQEPAAHESTCGPRRIKPVSNSDRQSCLTLISSNFIYLLQNAIWQFQLSQIHSPGASPQKNLLSNVSKSRGPFGLPSSRSKCKYLKWNSCGTLLFEINYFEFSFFLFSIVLKNVELEHFKCYIWLQCKILFLIIDKHIQQFEVGSRQCGRCCTLRLTFVKRSYLDSIKNIYFFRKLIYGKLC